MYPGLDLTPYSITNQLYRLKYPKCRHHKMTVAYADGGAKLSDTSMGFTGYVWVAQVNEHNQIVVRREDLSEFHVVTTKPNITQLDLAFDQNMRPFVCYVADGLPYYHSFDGDSSTYSEVALPLDIKFPRCDLDVSDYVSIDKSDIILGYTRGGTLCCRVQRDRFEKEYIIATDSKKTMLWRVGRSSDGRFCYQWR